MSINSKQFLELLKENKNLILSNPETFINLFFSSDEKFGLSGSSLVTMIKNLVNYGDDKTSKAFLYLFSDYVLLIKIFVNENIKYGDVIGTPFEPFARFDHRIKNVVKKSPSGRFLKINRIDSESLDIIFSEEQNGLGFDINYFQARFSIYGGSSRAIREQADKLVFKKPKVNYNAFVYDIFKRRNSIEYFQTVLDYYDKAKIYDNFVISNCQENPTGLHRGRIDKIISKSA